MNRFNLKNSTIQPLNTLTVANKNITSYFDKKDETFLVDPKFKFPSYSFEVITLLLYGNTMILKHKETTKSIEIPKFEFFYEYEAFMSKTIRSHLLTDTLKEVNSTNNDDTNHLTNNNHDTVKKTYNRDFFVQFIFDSFLMRDTIIKHLDLFLQTLRLRGIQLLPISFCVAIHLKQPHLGINFIRVTNGDITESEGYVFLEDFTVIDSHQMLINSLNSLRLTRDKTISHPIEFDYAEEFSRLKTLNTEQRYSCRKCDTKEFTEDAIIKHIQKDHKHLLQKKEAETSQFFYFFDKIDDFDSRAEYFFSSKMSRISKTKYLVTISKEEGVDSSDTGNNKMLVSFDDLIRAGEDFRCLDTSKEMWLTDKEWEIGRLGLLKEKILFYI